MRPFRIHEPTALEEAVTLLGRYGDEARVYAGGTEMLLAMKQGLLRYSHLVDIKTVSGLEEITFDPATAILRLGAAVTHRALEHSPVVSQEFPVIATAERSVANVRVRNVGTLAGNLCFAEPHSDPAAFLLLYDAQVEVRGSSESRTLPLEELTLGPYETCLEDDEILARVLVPKFPQGMRAAYMKAGHHHRPTVGLGAAIRLAPGPDSPGTKDGYIEEIRIAVGSAGPMAVRAREAEEFLQGKELTEIIGATSNGEKTLLERAGALAAREVSPMDDLHGSAEYKAHLVKVLLGRTLAKAVAVSNADETT